MCSKLEVSLLGGLRVVSGGREISLPASRKVRSLFAFLIVTGRPQRRETLCELLWDRPADPKAGLRWALTKLRKVINTPDRTRILANRERVQIDTDGIRIDFRHIQSRLQESRSLLSVKDLRQIAEQLNSGLMEGLDGSGDEKFDAWLTAERKEAEGVRVEALEKLATHPELTPTQAQKWLHLWQSADPVGFERFERLAPDPPVANSDFTRRQSRHGTDLHGASRPVHQCIGFCTARDGAKIAYATMGSGPPLLKAANWLNHLELDCSTPIWGGGFAAIAQNRTFVRYDERGCGLSDWDVKDLSFNAFVEDLELVVDKLGLDRFPLLGISQGCAVSIEYAVRYPERVTCLVLVGGFAAGWRHAASPEEQERREALIKLTELGWGSDNSAYRRIFSQTFMPDASTDDLDWFDEFQRLTTSASNAARFQDAFGRINVLDRLKKVRTPTIVFHSRQDQRIPFSQGREIASEIQGAQFVPLESRNHILVEYEPAWRVFCETAIRFISEKGL